MLKMYVLLCCIVRYDYSKVNCIRKYPHCTSVHTTLVLIATYISSYNWSRTIALLYPRFTISWFAIGHSGPV